MSYTTDYLLEVMDRNQIEDVNELQEYFSVVQNDTVTITSIVKEKRNESKKMDVLPS